MRRILAVLTLLLLLTGCGSDFQEMDDALTMRQKLLGSQGCSFEAVITADYGDSLYTFGMQCRGSGNGDVNFTVTMPETISGITGMISEEGGKLTYDGLLLAFSSLIDGQLSPVCAPWLMLRTLRSGYISSCGKDGSKILICTDDSFAEESMQMQIWLDEGKLPAHCEIIWDGRRILSVDVVNFVYL